MPTPLTRQQVLDTTLALAEEHGLEAVSMREVARRLGVTPMALYRHVGTKQGLVDGLIERLLEELPVPDADLPWPDRLHALAAALRATARRHPDMFLMLLRRPANTPAALDRRNVVYDALTEAGVPDELVPRVERLLSTFIIGFAASEAAGRFAEHDPAELDEDLAWLEARARELLT